MTNSEHGSPFAMPFARLLLFARDDLGRTLAGTRIGVRTLAADGQRAAMAQTPVAAEVHQALDVHRNFAAQVAFDLVVAVNGFADLQHFSVGQLVHTAFRRNADLLHDLRSEFCPDAMDILQRDDDALVRRNVDASYTGHLLLHVGRQAGDCVDPRPVEAGPCGFPFRYELLCPRGPSSLMPDWET